MNEILDMLDMFYANKHLYKRIGGKPSPYVLIIYFFVGVVNKC